MKIHSTCRFTGILKNWIGIQSSGWCGGGSGGNAIYSKASRAAYDALTWPQVVWGSSKQFDSPAGKVGGGIFTKSRAHGYADAGYQRWKKTVPQVGAYGAPHYDGQISDLDTVVPISMGWVDASTGLEGMNHNPTFPSYDPNTYLNPLFTGTRGTMVMRVDLKQRTGNYMVMASYDPVAGDVAMAMSEGWSQLEILRDGVAEPGPEAGQLYYAHQHGLGQNDPRGIDFKGVDTLPVSSPTFLRPRFAYYTPAALNTYNAFPCAIHPDFAA